MPTAGNGGGPASGRRFVGWGRRASFGDLSGSGRNYGEQVREGGKEAQAVTREDAVGGPGQGWRGALVL